MNLSTFNFKKWPKAFLITLVILLFIEGVSFILIKQIEEQSKGGDLIKMDPNFFCNNFKQYAQAPIQIKYQSDPNKTWKEIGKEKPFDVIVFGSSVGDTGWPEMLKVDYNLNIANTTANPNYRADLPYSLINLLQHYKELNNSNKATLLFVHLTERGSYKIKPTSHNQNLFKQVQAPARNQSSKVLTPLAKLIDYSLNKLKVKQMPQVGIITFNQRKDLFYLPDLEGLSMKVNYNNEERDKLVQQFENYKKIADQFNCNLAIVAFPTKAQLYEWQLKEKGIKNATSPRKNLKLLQYLAKENKIPFLNLEEKLAPISKELYLATKASFWGRSDTHMNQLGSYYTAKEIDQFIKEINP